MQGNYNLLIIIALVSTIVGCQKQVPIQTDPQHRILISMVGNSITAQAKDWNQYCNISKEIYIKNDGRSGDMTNSLYERLNHICDNKPNILFLLIGINDLNMPKEPAIIASNTEGIILKIKELTPKTIIVIQSVLPVNFKDFVYPNKINHQNIIELNKRYSQIASKYSLRYLDLFSLFVNNNGDLKKVVSTDGLHLNSLGYELWGTVLKTTILDIISEIEPQTISHIQSPLTKSPLH